MPQKPQALPKKSRSLPRFYRPAAGPLPPEYLAYRRVKEFLRAEAARLADDDQHHRLHCLLMADILGRSVFLTAGVPLSPAQEEAVARFLAATG
jgi:hypothetical protein